ncbi:MAG: hypothetical protein IJ777_01795 [Clostridia bacterium]|nr:hypothetical protein [Clostridia bacterium]
MNNQIKKKQDMLVEDLLNRSYSQYRGVALTPCTTCPVGTHCKNHNLKGIVHSMKKGSTTPDCFSGFHSVK